MKKEEEEVAAAERVKAEELIEISEVDLVKSLAEIETLNIASRRGEGRETMIPDIILETTIMEGKKVGTDIEEIVKKVGITLIGTTEVVKSGEENVVKIGMVMTS